MGPREIIVIAVIVVLLFGAPKLPELARSIGKSMRILKDETQSLTGDSESDKTGKSDKTSKSDSALRTDAEQAQQRGAAPVPESTIETPDDERRGSH